MGLTIYFDIASVILCALMLGSLLIRGLDKGRTNRLFLLLISLVIIASLLDMSTNLYGPVLPENIYTVPDQRIQNYFYFFLRNLTTPIFIVYITSLLGQWHKFNDTKWYRPLLVVPYLIDVAMLILNMFMPVVFGFNGYGQYYRGDYIWVLYLVAFYYMFFGLVLIIRCRKALALEKRIVIGAFIPVTAMAIGVQLLHPVWRIEIISSAFMSFLIAIIVQRPEENLDKTVNTQSYSAFLDCVNACFELKRPIGVIFVKITNHKDIRNSIGSEKFNILLKNIADKMNKAGYVMRITDDIYYLDRGIFAVINDVSLKDNLEDYGRIITAYLSDPVKVSGMEIQIESKVILATVPNDINDKNELINFAFNFHKAVEASNKLLFLSNYSESKDFMVRTTIDSIISKAISEKRFVMYYQPIYSLKDKKFTSAEALIRLVDPEFGFVSPGIFIPAAEMSGAIHKIGDYVLDEVCKFISEYDIKKYGLEYIELNLSVAQCMEPNLVQKIENATSKYGVDKNMLNLEITETATDFDQQTTDNNISTLSEMGYKFSLDDYGTGYSNIMRLTKLPVDIVKLDKSFVDDMNRYEMYTVIKNTIHMIKKMNKKIVVEGVEEKLKLDKFENLGCDYIQGYYYSRPLPVRDFVEFIRRENYREG